MTRIVWRNPGDLTYEDGVSNGVLYPTSGEGVPWDGLISVSETVSGGEQEGYYFDGTKYKDVILSEDFAATIEAYNAPVEFAVSDGQRQLAAGLFLTSQPRLPFGLCWRTRIGNDLTDELGYKLHIAYNCMAAPSERTWATRSEAVAPTTKSWAITAVPPPIPQAADYPTAGHPINTWKPTAHFVIDSTLGGYSFSNDKPKIEVLEDILYGKVGVAPRLATPGEVIDILDTYGLS